MLIEKEDIEKTDENIQKVKVDSGDIRISGLGIIILQICFIGYFLGMSVRQVRLDSNTKLDKINHIQLEILKEMKITNELLKKSVGEEND